MHPTRDIRAFAKALASFPWKGTAITMRERFREDRLGLTASSLTFTTMIALVPLITVALALFTAFPMFGKLQLVVQKWLVESLVPDNIARQVLSYLTQFAGQASRLGAAGVALLFISALALMFTIDRTLNKIWRVRQTRALAHRVLVYWAAMTLGPVLVGASATLTTYAVSASKGLAGGLPGGVGLVLDVVQYVLLAAGMAALFRYVPNTRVPWSHAWTGGLFVSTGMELAKKLLVLYLGKVPTFSVVYGAFATVPILLVWIYLAWVIVLLGAVITAYLPSLRAGVERRDLGAGWRFQLALESLQLLHRAREDGEKGLTVAQLASRLRVSHLGIDSALDALVQLDWVARLDEEPDGGLPRYVLLADPDSTLMEPLLRQLLVRRTDSTENLWNSARWSSVTLREVL